jgi:Flp pilus assembly pilin Flp
MARSRRQPRSPRSRDGQRGTARPITWPAFNSALEGGEFKVLTWIRSRFAREEGQTMAEYAVVLAVITVATVAVFTALSGGIQGAVNNVTSIL